MGGGRTTATITVDLAADPRFRLIDQTVKTQAGVELQAFMPLEGYLLLATLVEMQEFAARLRTAVQQAGLQTLPMSTIGKGLCEIAKPARTPQELPSIRDLTLLLCAVAQ